MIIHTKCCSLWTTPWPDKNSIFLKIEKSKKSIFPIEIRTFFLWKLGGLFSLSQSLPTLRILHTKFGLIWRTSWPDKKRPIFKIPFSRNSKSSIWNTNFFHRQAITKTLFVLLFNFTGDTPCQLWFDLDQRLTRWKRPTFKFHFPRNSKSSVWNTNFFVRQAIPKFIFVLHFHYTGDTPCRVWFDLNNSLTR